MSETELTTELTVDQQRRAIALANARKMLETRAGAFGGTSLSEKRTTQEVIELANFILDNGDEKPVLPWAEDEAGRESDVSWGRRQGYAEGIKAAMTVVSAGGGTDDLNKLLGEDRLAEWTPLSAPTPETYDDEVSGPTPIPVLGTQEEDDEELRNQH